MTLFLNNDDIGQVLRPSEFIDTLDAAYREHAKGNGLSLPRLDIQTPLGGANALYQLGLAIGTVGPRYAAIRLKSDMVFKRIVEGKPRKEKYCVEPGKFMGLILLFDIANGALLSIMQDGLIQKLRVGCDSALGVRLLARPEAAVLGILGAGGMAQTHLEAIRLVRELREVRFYSPTRENREAIAARARAQGIDARAVDAPEALFRGADIVAGCTSAIGPVIPGALVEPGMHIVCIGGTLDDAASAKLDVVLRFGNAAVPAELPELDATEECLTYAVGGGKSEAGSASRYAQPRPGTEILLADLLADPSRGRTAAEQITFSERGPVHGVEFAAVAGLIYEKAEAAKLGHTIPTEMFLETIRN